MRSASKPRTRVTKNFSSAALPAPRARSSRGLSAWPNWNWRLSISRTLAGTAPERCTSRRNAKPASKLAEEHRAEALHLGQREHLHDGARHDAEPALGAEQPARGIAADRLARRRPSRASSPLGVTRRRSRARCPRCCRSGSSSCRSRWSRSSRRASRTRAVGLVADREAVARELLVDLAAGGARLDARPCGSRVDPEHAVHAAHVDRDDACVARPRGQRSASVTLVPPPYGIRQTPWRARELRRIARTSSSLSGHTTRSGTRARRPYLIAHMSSCVWPWPWRRRTRGSVEMRSAGERAPRARPRAPRSRRAPEPPSGSCDACVSWGRAADAEDALAPTAAGSGSACR